MKKEKKDWKKLRVIKNTKKGIVEMSFEIEVTPNLVLVGFEHDESSCLGRIKYSFSGAKSKYGLTYDSGKQWIISLIADDKTIPKDVAEEFDVVVREAKIMNVLNAIITEGFRRCWNARLKKGWY